MLVFVLYVTYMNKLVFKPNTFSHAGMEPSLPGYYQCFRGVKCHAQGHNTAYVGFES